MLVKGGLGWVSTSAADGRSVSEVDQGWLGLLLAVQLVEKRSDTIAAHPGGIARAECPLVRAPATRNTGFQNEWIRFEIRSLRPL
ncbi:MAG: hypothetical protein IIA01_07885 [Proteobacteria bacterium]|nr:hypothetical protein [Pseudomonadota bacterium]